MGATENEQIRELLAQGLSTEAVAARLGVGRQSVAAIRAHMTMGTYARSRSNGAGVSAISTASGIYLRRDGELISLNERSYETEDVLQALVAEHPGLLAGEDVGNSPRRWLLLAREVGVADSEGGTSRWSLDHLFVDQDAVPTLVEVKRGSDTRIRREVVGQLLEYAANGAHYWPGEQLRRLHEIACSGRGDDPDDVVRTLVGDDVQLDDWWSLVDSNLRSGRLRLVFVADVISRELRRIIEFLNEQMTVTDVLGVEIRQYVDQDGQYQALVPRLIGQTEAARDAKRLSSRPRTAWGDSDLLEAVEASNTAEVAVRMTALYEFMRDRGARRSWGTGARPSVNMWLGERDDELSNPVAIGISSDQLYIWFDFVRDRRTPEQMQRLADLMRAIPGVARYFEGLEDRNWGMHPGMNAADVLGSDDALRAWQAALDAAVLHS